MEIKLVPPFIVPQDTWYNLSTFFAESDTGLSLYDSFRTADGKKYLVSSIEDCEDFFENYTVIVAWLVTNIRGDKPDVAAVKKEPVIKVISSAATEFMATKVRNPMATVNIVPNLNNIPDEFKQSNSNPERETSDNQLSEPKPKMGSRKRRRGQTVIQGGLLKLRELFRA